MHNKSREKSVFVNVTDKWRLIFLIVFLGHRFASLRQCRNVSTLPCVRGTVPLPPPLISHTTCCVHLIARYSPLSAVSVAARVSCSCAPAGARPVSPLSAMPPVLRRPAPPRRGGLSPVQFRALTWPLSWWYSVFSCAPFVREACLRSVQLLTYLNSLISGFIERDFKAVWCVRIP